MSTSDLYILNIKSTRHLAEFKNGWGSAPIAWDYLADKYLGPIEWHEDKWKLVWGLADDTRLKDYERIVLMMTFDRAFVPVDKLKEAGRACETFAARCENGSSVNHWGAIGRALHLAASQKFSRYARGVCLSPTSVSDNWGSPSKHWLESAWSIYDE